MEGYFMLLTALFWKNALVRALKTAAQTAVALLGADAVNVVTVPWATVGAVAAGAAVVSLLMSVSQADAITPPETTPVPFEGAPSDVDDPEAEELDDPAGDEEDVPDLAQPVKGA